MLSVSGGNVPWGPPPAMPQGQGTLRGCFEVGSEDGFSSAAVETRWNLKNILLYWELRCRHGKKGMGGQDTSSAGALPSEKGRQQIPKLPELHQTP